MRLRGRIRKIEEKFSTNRRADDCQCFEQHLKSCIDEVYDDEPFEESIASKALPLPDFSKSVCDLCQKTISPLTKQHANGLLGNIALLYGEEVTA